MRTKTDKTNDVLGIDPDAVDKIKKDLVTGINNKDMLFPPQYLSPIEYVVSAETLDDEGINHFDPGDKGNKRTEYHLIYIRVPESSNVVRRSEKISDRNHDSDVDVADNEQLAYQIYARKQSTYFVNKVYPIFQYTDLRKDLIDRACRMAWLGRVTMSGRICRDYSNAYVVKLIIQKEQIIIENANRAHGFGNLDMMNFESFPKNPPISKIFRGIGLADELGSGMRNSYKYTKMYSGGVPSFTEGDIFRITIPLSPASTVSVGPMSEDELKHSGIETDVELENMAPWNPKVQECCTNKS